MSASHTDRRTLIGAGALIAGAGLIAARPAEAGAAKPWQPAREPLDDWMELPGTRHRMVFDTIGAKGFGDALFYAANFYAANKLGYDLAPASLGVIIIARHMSTPLAYSDAIWAKYGAAFAKVMGLEGVEAERAKSVNPLLSPMKPAEGEEPQPSVSTLADKGARFAVCGMATTFIAGMLAKGGSTPAKEIEAELRAGLVRNAVMVPAGIAALNRAQERGYAFAYVG